MGPVTEMILSSHLEGKRAYQKTRPAWHGKKTMFVAAMGNGLSNIQYGVVFVHSVGCRVFRHLLREQRKTFIRYSGAKSFVMERGKDGRQQDQTPTVVLWTAAEISLMRPGSFSIALPTTITSAPALQLR